MGSVTFTFKALNTGTGTFNISDLVLSSNTATIGTKSVSVTVQKASNTSNKTNTGNKKPTTTTPEPEPEPQPQEFEKAELTQVLADLEELVGTDYTTDSWNVLQEAITKAQNAATVEEYDEVKGSLKVSNLVVAEFEKEELMEILIALMGKTQKDYTEESWKELQDTIIAAQAAKLKSEYEEVKDKLTIDILQKKDGVKEFFENFIQGLERKDPFYLAFAGCVLALILVIVILLIVVCRGRRDRRSDYNARRMR